MHVYIYVSIRGRRMNARASRHYRTSPQKEPAPLGEGPKQAVMAACTPQARRLYTNTHLFARNWKCHTFTVGCYRAIQTVDILVRYYGRVVLVLVTDLNISWSNLKLLHKM